MSTESNATEINITGNTQTTNTIILIVLCSFFLANVVLFVANINHVSNYRDALKKDYVSSLKTVASAVNNQDRKLHLIDSVTVVRLNTVGSELLKIRENIEALTQISN